MQLNANDWERSAFGGWVKNAIDSERKEFAKLFIKKHQSRSKTFPAAVPLATCAA